ncbi:unnamed protein product, partial [Adineta steineri]
MAGANITEHQQILNDIINDYDQFEQRINEKKQNPQNPQNDLLIKQIDEWESNSIEIIHQKAQECREIAMRYLPTFFNDIEKKFNDLNERIRQVHQEIEFDEIDLNYLRNQLIDMTAELNNPSKISIKQDSQSFINEISIISSIKPTYNKWKQNAITVAGGNGQGQELNQLNWSARIFIDEMKNVFIVDHHNHRIVVWNYNAQEAQIIAGGNRQGSRMNQLNYPTDVIIDQQNDSIIIADHGNRRVIQWLNQNQQILINNIDCFGLAMDRNGFLYV